MMYNQPLEQVVSLRKSVRTYTDKPLPREEIRALEEYAAGLSDPFGGGVRIRLLQADAPGAEKLGTYGTIRGATSFLAAAVKRSELSLEALGFEFETLVLFAASRGLGTCWLGGSFRKSRFAAAMRVGHDEIFPVVSPVGYPAEQKRAVEVMMRRAVGADHRRPWEELFFDGSFGRPLAPEAAGEYRLPLKLLRLAPSSSNSQPWRVVRDGEFFHFFEQKAQGLAALAGYDMRRIDMGIAACHFQLAADELGLAGGFCRLTDPLPGRSSNLQYIVSWKSGRPDKMERS